jgi:hypothetical protein
MAYENRYQYLKIKGIGDNRRWMPIATKGGFLSSPYDSTIPTLPISQTIFCVPLKTSDHPPSKFGKTMHRNLGASIANHKNK